MQVEEALLMLVSSAPACAWRMWHVREVLRLRTPACERPLAACPGMIVGRRGGWCLSCPPCSAMTAGATSSLGGKPQGAMRTHVQAPGEGTVPAPQKFGGTAVQLSLLH